MSSSKTSPSKANLQVYYENQVVPELKKKFQFRNVMEVPKIIKISVNMGVGKATEDIKFVEAAQKDLSAITGQHAVITRSKKAISNFKIRENMPIGCKVTLRKKAMYEFLERLTRVALPRVRDFKGLNPRGFDHAGNYTFGVAEQTIFPEIETDKVLRVQGMDVTIVISGSKSKEQSHELLTLMGVPFRVRTEKPAQATVAAA